MRGLLLALSIFVAMPPSALAQLRTPSCEVLIAFGQGSRQNVIEMSFGKPVDAMTADDFADALAVVSACMDATQAGPPDVPGLTPRERKSAQINALTAIAEDLALYRNRQRERMQLVPRTRSSHNRAASPIANFGFKKGH